MIGGFDFDEQIDTDYDLWSRPSRPARKSYRSMSRPERANTLLPFFAVMDAHHASEQVHHANLRALQLPHFCRDAFLRRVVLQGFQNVSVGRRSPQKILPNSGTNHFRWPK